MTKLLPRPALYCPFPSQISPFEEAVEARNLEWLKTFGLYSSNQGRIRAARFGHLAARAYPEASLETLEIAAAWASWLFLRDDLCDEAGIGSDPGALRVSSERFLGVLAGVEDTMMDDPLAVSLADLRLRMLERAGAHWLARFIHNVQEYFEGCVWEAHNRRRGETPDLDTYLSVRDLTGAVKTCFDIGELAGTATLPIHVRHLTPVLQMTQMANRVICWSNDIFSVEKELRHGDCHNLVIVLQRQRRLPLENAVLTAARMHDDEVKRFIGMQRRFFAGGRHPELRRFVRSLEVWMRANLDWSLETGRYEPMRVDSEDCAA